MASRRFLFALFASLLLHGAVVGSGWLERLLRTNTPRPAKAPLQAELRPAEAQPERPDSALLKNTIDDDIQIIADAPRVQMPSPARDARRRSAQAALAVRSAQRKLSQVLFYPPEAVARGLEGEARVLLRLDGQGRVLDARIASSSGYELLDEAALQAAHALGRIDGALATEMILPVVFRLQ